MKLLEAEINMQSWRFLPSLLCLHDAHSKLGAWVSLPNEVSLTVCMLKLKVVMMLAVLVLNNS